MLKLLIIPYMAWVSRMAGGGKPKLPYGLDAWILSAPYLLLWGDIGLWAVPSYLMAVLAIRTGHGRGFQYKVPFEADSKPEKVEALIPDNLPVYWQKFLIMFITGIGVTIIPAIVLIGYGYILAGVILAVSGAAKAVAYMTSKTETSEYLRGSFLGIGLTCVLALT